MKPKLLLTIMIGILTFSISACTPKEEPSGDVSEETTTNENAEDSELSAKDELEALGDVEVEENLLSVEITLPAEYSEGTTQEEIDASVGNDTFKSATVNADGSITYKMSKKQHKALLADIAEQYNSALQEMVGSESTPNITEISANEDFTHFTVKTKSTELDLAESFSVLALYMYGGIYGIFNEYTPDNIAVEFYNADSGELIESANSKDWKEN